MKDEPFDPYGFGYLNQPSGFDLGSEIVRHCQEFFLVVVSLGVAILVLILVALLVFAHCLREREKKDYKQ